MKRYEAEGREGLKERSRRPKHSPNATVEGLIGMQAHSGGKFVVQFKDISIKELPPTVGAPTWKGVELKAWPKKN